MTGFLEVPSNMPKPWFIKMTGGEKEGEEGKGIEEEDEEEEGILKEAEAGEREGEEGGGEEKEGGYLISTATFTPSESVMYSLIKGAFSGAL
jgi:hypothetical protein